MGTRLELSTIKHYTVLQPATVHSLCLMHTPSGHMLRWPDGDWRGDWSSRKPSLNYRLSWCYYHCVVELSKLRDIINVPPKAPAAEHRLASSSGGWSHVGWGRRDRQSLPSSAISWSTLACNRRKQGRNTCEHRVLSEVEPKISFS